MNPIDFTLFAVAFAAAFLLIPYAGHVFVKWVAKTSFYPWRRSRRRI